MSNIVVFILAVFSAFSFNKVQFNEPEQSFHPVHVTYTNVEYNSKEKEFKVLYKIFADDFDKILQKKYNVFLNLEKENRQKDYEKTITKYIIANFSISVNNKSLIKPRFVRSEFKDKAIWLYYSYKFKGKSNRFEIKNSLMTDLYKDQTNLLIFNYLNFQQAIRFTNNKTIEILLIEE